VIEKGQNNKNAAGVRCTHGGKKPSWCFYQIDDALQMLAVIVLS